MSPFLTRVHADQQGCESSLGLRDLPAIDRYDPPLTEVTMHELLQSGEECDWIGHLDAPTGRDQSELCNLPVRARLPALVEKGLPEAAGELGVCEHICE